MNKGLCPSKALCLTTPWFNCLFRRIKVLGFLNASFVPFLKSHFLSMLPVLVYCATLLPSSTDLWGGESTSQGLTVLVRDGTLWVYPADQPSSPQTRCCTNGAIYGFEGGQTPDPTSGLACIFSCVSDNATPSLWTPSADWNTYHTRRRMHRRTQAQKHTLMHRRT